MKRHISIIILLLWALMLPGCKPAPASTPQVAGPQTMPTTTAPEPTEPNPFVTVYMLTGRTCTVDGSASAGTLTFVYDDAGRVVEVTMDGAVAVTRTYDEQGNCLAYKNTLEDIDQTYDAQGNLLTDRTAEATLTYTYDEAGRCTQLDKHSADGTLLSVTRYTYDEQGHLLSEVLEQDGSVYSEIQHTYDEAGNHLTQTYYRNGEVSPEGPSYIWRYDAYNHLEHERLYYADDYWQESLYYYVPRADLQLAYMVYDSDGYFADIAHHFDDKGRLTHCNERIRDAEGNTYSTSDRYEYDEHGNTVVSTHVDSDGNAWTYRWSYDVGGTVMTGCSLTSPEESYEYAWTFDEKGRKVMEIRAGDNPHHIIWEYDRLGKLRSVIAGGSMVYKETYTYDEQGNLIQLQREADGVTTVSSYTYTAVSVLPEVAAQLQAQQHSLLGQVIQAATDGE